LKIVTKKYHNFESEEYNRIISSTSKKVWRDGKKLLSAAEIVKTF
jgi:hypothetical protein